MLRRFLPGFLFLLPLLGTAETVPVSISDASTQQVLISPAGGRWLSIAQSNLVFDATHNRLYSVVFGGRSETPWGVAGLDAGTQGFAGFEITRTQANVRPLDVLFVPDPNLLAIAWGDSQASLLGTEREIPSRVEFFDLDTFSATDSVLAELPFYLFDWDSATYRVVGIADSDEDPGHYVFQPYDPSDHTAGTPVSTQIPRDSAIPRAALFDPNLDRLLVLYLPTLEGQPDLIERFGFVVAYNAQTGEETIRSATFAGEFNQHSLALSPLGDRLAIIPTASNNREIPVLQPDTLAFLPFIQEASFSTTFEANGAGVFVDPTTLWVANARESESDESLGVFDFLTGTPAALVADASQTQFFQVDRLAHKVFAGSFDLQQIHIASATSTRVATHLDVALDVADMEVDPVQDVVQILSRSGLLYLVCEREPRFLGRYLDFGINPTVGLVPDPIRNRLFVGRQASRPPLVLETNGYRSIGNLSTRAGALTLDASRNLLYTADRVTDGSPSLVVRELDGETFELIREVGRVPGFHPFGLPQLPLFAPPSPRRLEVDPHSQVLWSLSPEFLSEPAALRTFNLTSSETKEFRFPPATPVEDLFLDLERGRALVWTDSTGPSSNALLLKIALDSPSLEPQPAGDLQADFVFDFAKDLDHQLAYFLTYDFEVPHWRLVSFDLVGDNVAAVHSLDFLSGENARMAFNPSTNRFTVVGGVGDVAYRFENPTDPIRRPPPEIVAATVQTDSTPPADFSGRVVGRIGGVQLSWNVDDDRRDLIEGYVLDRRRAGFDSFIRLTPLPLPPGVTTWTDITLDPEEEAEYRITPLTRANLVFESLVLAASAVTREQARWVVDLPELLIPAEPETQATFLFHLLEATSPSETVQLVASASVPLEVQVSSAELYAPGTASVRVTIPQATARGTYPVSLSVSRGGDRSTYTTLLSIEPNLALGQRSSILRFPPVIPLSSDSDLDDQRLSFRGLVGVLRSLAQPIPMVVEALLPEGLNLSSQVVASTGEFTADFSVPMGSPAGDWEVRTVFPGSFRTVGAESRPFTFPVFDTQTKQTEGSVPDFDLGQLVIVNGVPPGNNTNAGLQYLSDRISDTFANQRFVKEKQTILHQPTLAAFETGLSESAQQTSAVTVLVLMGDAVPNGAGGIDFRINPAESLDAQTLADLVSDIRQTSVPIVFLECPHSARFATVLQQETEGAYIFSCRDGWLSDYLEFGPDAFNFTDSLQKRIRGGLGLGRAFQAIEPFFSIPIGGIVSGQNPTEQNATSERFLDYQPGSHLTPSRSTQEDRIPPVFVDLAPSVIGNIGEKVPVFAHIQDPPFEKEVDLMATVTHPDGYLERFTLSGDANSDPVSASFTLRLPGFASIVYEAEDSAGNLTYAQSLSGVPTGSTSNLFSPEDLLEVLDYLAQPSTPEEKEQFLESDPILGASQLWYKEPLESK